MKNKTIHVITNKVWYTLFSKGWDQIRSEVNTNVFVHVHDHLKMRVNRQLHEQIKDNIRL
jgi:hypothetical protein